MLFTLLDRLLVREYAILVATGGKEWALLGLRASVMCYGSRALGLSGSDETKSGGHTTCLHIHASGFAEGFQAHFASLFLRGLLRCTEDFGRDVWTGG